MCSRALALLACIVFGGCANLSPVRQIDQEPAAIQQMAHTEAAKPCVLYVMSNGFHSGLVLKRAHIPAGAWPELDKLPDHDWVEVGWGSEIFYRAKRITPGVVFGALVPNPSVLHVVGWDDPPYEVFPGDLIRLEIDEEHCRELCSFIRSSYRLTTSKEPEDLGPGIYGDSRFFRARGLYYFPNTCNMWTARALDRAGVPIVPELCSTADAVLGFAGRSGQVMQRR